MNKRLLIVNRGEIAIRIMRTAKQMGITTVVLQSARESDALYIQQADEVISVNGSADEKPIFLQPEKVVALALEYKIDLIHPGYGFLSENPDFADLCREKGIIFIGPSPELIRNMGLKTVAKEMALTAGMPLVPGSNGTVASAEEAIQIANSIGYPVLLKASAGGGGRGMRVVDKPETMVRHFKSAADESRSAFGNDNLFIEKYIANPKHIEFQIIGDQHGNVIHLGERECSLQRKHQKMIEEAPSPSLSDEKRREMGELAVRFSKKIGYYSAGTIEFIVAEDGSYYFMEMNTRIQVEHPVTEMITGVDLIEWQIRIALNEQLSLRQSDIQLQGWAIECRVNTEDTQNRFAPETGFIERVLFPEGSGIRIETGIANGSVITPYFDSMAAKVIVHDSNRQNATAKMIKALDAVRITGLKTTIPFCRVVLRHPDFISGKYTTRWVEDNYSPEMFYNEDEEMIGALAASIAYSMEYNEIASNSPGFTNESMSMWVLNKRINK